MAVTGEGFSLLMKAKEILRKSPLCLKITSEQTNRSLFKTLSISFLQAHIPLHGQKGQIQNSFKVVLNVS